LRRAFSDCISLSFMDGAHSAGNRCGWSPGGHLMYHSAVSQKTWQLLENEVSRFSNRRNLPVRQRCAYVMAVKANISTTDGSRYLPRPWIRLFTGSWYLEARQMFGTACCVCWPAPLSLTPDKTSTLANFTSPQQR